MTKKPGLENYSLIEDTKELQQFDLAQIEQVCKHLNSLRLEGERLWAERYNLSTKTINKIINCLEAPKEIEFKLGKLVLPTPEILSFFMPDQIEKLDMWLRYFMNHSENTLRQLRHDEAVKQFNQSQGEKELVLSEIEENKELQGLITAESVV